MSDPKAETAKQKACLCQVRLFAGAVFKATGKTNPQGQSEYSCRICGRTEWR
jgi:hypothetical protein